MFNFVSPTEAFARPKLQDFAEDQSYDYYAYDMALDQWRSQFPDLYENWCGERETQQEEPEVDLMETLMAALAA
jgi:hypothetical protein